MKLTDEKIIELIDANSEFYASSGEPVIGDIPGWQVLDFAHAIMDALAEEQAQDTKRLDYLEKYAVIAKSGQSVREAIDEAMWKDE